MSKELLQVKINDKTRQQLDRLSEQTMLNKSALVRFLINQAAQQQITFQPLTLEKASSNDP